MKASPFKVRLPLKNLRIETYSSNDYIPTTEATTKNMIKTSKHSERNHVKFSPSNNGSKLITEEFAKSENRTLMFRNSSVPNLRNDVVLPQISATPRNVVIPQEDSHRRKPKGGLQNYSSSPRATIIMPKSDAVSYKNPLFRKIEVDSRLDFTSPIFFKQLRRLFPQTNGLKSHKILLHESGLPQYVSSRNAERILQCLENELKSIQKMKMSVKADSEINTGTFRNLTDESRLIEDLDSALTEILEICEETLTDYKHREPMNSFLKDIVRIGQQSMNSELALYCIYMQGQVYAGRNDIKDAISLFKSYKNQCIPHKLFSNKIYAYKNLGRCYQDVRKHKTALIYFTKFLQMAWYLESPKYEFLAYDFIGRQYYYLGKTEKANYYHNKMMSGKIEPKDSRFRQVAVYKIAINKDIRNKYLHYEQKTNLGFIDGEEDFDDEDREISSREEAIELPETLQEEKDSWKRPSKKEHGSGDSYPNAQLRENSEGKPKRKRVAIKKDVIVNQKGHKRNFSGLDSLMLGHERTDSLAKLKQIHSMLYPKLLRQKNPNDEIVLSHLSRNRNMRTFNLAIGQEITHKNTQASDLDPIGLYESKKVKKVIEKFRANIQLVKHSLQICSVGLANSKLPYLESSSLRKTANYNYKKAV